MPSFYHWFWYLLPANPIFLRVLQGGSRRSRHLWVRMGYLGALIMLVLFGLMSGQGMAIEISLTELAKAGTAVFAIVSYGQVILVCLLAPIFMAAAINDEQSGETFDILLTTPLSNLQIVLGSLASRLFFVLALLLSGLPLFAVLLIFGGVPIRSIFVAFAVAALTAITVGSVAITLAVLRQGGRKSVYVFIIAIAGYLVACYGVDRLLRYSSAAVAAAPVAAAAPADASPADGSGDDEADPADASTAAAPAPTTLQSTGPTAAQAAATSPSITRTTFLTPLHPLLVLEASLNSSNYRPYTPEELAGRSLGVRVYYGSPLLAFTLFTGLLSLGLVLFSAIQVRRVGEGERLIPLPKFLRRWLRLGTPGERRRPARTVWTNPIAWREANARANNAGAILGRGSFLLVAAGVSALLIWGYHIGALPIILDNTGAPLSQADTFKFLLQILLWVELAAVVLVAMYMSSGCISKEREDGTLDLMLTTPVTPQYFIWGKMRGTVSFLVTILAAPFITLLLVSLYTLIGLMMGWPQAMMDYAYTVQSVMGGSNAQTVQAPLILLEAPLLLLLMLVPFVALCVAVGMTFSLKARGVMGAVVPAMGIIGGVMMVTGFCGYAAGREITILGPIMNAFSPITNIMMLISPWNQVASYAESPGIGRVNLWIAAVIAAAGYTGIVYVMSNFLTKGFDHTVRRLSGTG